MKKEKVIGLVVVLILLGGIAYFFISSETTPPGEIPSYVKGDIKIAYEWTKDPEGIGWKITEQLPCYCGCKYEGHLHARHCFWRDDRTFDKHGITCSVCVDIAKKAKNMYEQGKNICEIRKEIDEFYKPNAELSTDTPMPEGC